MSVSSAVGGIVVGGTKRRLEECTIWHARYKNTSVHGCLAHMEYSEITVLVIAYGIN